MAHQRGLRLNLLANFAGQGWSTLMGFVFTPIYIRMMGIESYGLIGVFATVQAILALLDLGLSPTLNRELARFSAQPELSPQARDLVRTLEIVYWAIGLVVGGLMMVAAPFVATRWLRVEHIPVESVARATAIIGLLTIVQWPLSLYQSGLLGLQKQVMLNGLNAFTGTFRGVGAVAALSLISPTVDTYFYWQVLVGVVNLAAIALLLWRNLPQGLHPPRFSGSLLRSVWRFAAGMSGTSLMTAILRQMDKIILSRLLTLEMYGYYTLAGIAANSLSLFVGPIFRALFPYFAALAVAPETDEIRLLYHRSCQLVSVIALPTSLVVAVFPYELLLAWTRNAVAAQTAAPVVSILAIGTALNSLVGLPYDVQTAHGWVKLGLLKNVVAVIVLTPSIWWLAVHFGAIGAATAWLLLNLGYFTIEIPIMHRRLLRGEMARWYMHDVGMPLVATAAMLAAGRWLVTLLGADVQLPAIAFVSLSTLAVATASAPLIRGPALSYCQRIAQHLGSAYGS